LALVGSPYELTGVGLGQVQDLGDAPVGVVEGLAQDVGGAFRGRQSPHAISVSHPGAVADAIFDADRRTR
jgi:hypothetical protein